MDHRIGHLTLHPHRQLMNGREAVAIGRRALDLLSVLVEARGRVVTKSELMEAVWPGVIVEENTLQVQISALRKALGPEARRLVSSRGRGYRFDQIEPRHGSAGAEARTFDSVAIMPFLNLTNDRANGYLADGIAEELICTLSANSSLRVPARTSTFAYKGRDADVRLIARDLGVEAVVEGSISGSGDTLRISARLIDATNGFRIWSDSYHRDRGDIVVLHHHIATEIAAALRARLAKSTSHEPDGEALQYYLQARQLWSGLTKDRLARTIEVMQKAIATDPLFARGWADLAAILIDDVNFGSKDPLILDGARRAAEQALTLDPELARAQAALGGILAMTGHPRQAEEAFEKAIAAGEQEPSVHLSHAMLLLLPYGLARQAGQAIETAYSLAPAWSLASIYRGLMASFRDDFPEAIRQLELAVALGYPENAPPIPGIRAHAAEFGSRFDGLLDLEIAALPAHATATSRMAIEHYCAALMGTMAKTVAVESLRQAQAASRQDLATSVLPLATWALPHLIILGACDACFEIMEFIALARERWGYVDHFALNFLWKDRAAYLRADPRFQEFVRRMGMIPFWERYGPPDGHRLENGKLICL